MASPKVPAKRNATNADEQLRELSTALGTAPQALAQEWIMQRLRYEFAQYERQTSQPRR